MNMLDEIIANTSISKLEPEDNLDYSDPLYKIQRANKHARHSEVMIPPFDTIAS